MFVYVLEYLSGNGHVILPMTMSKEAFLADLRSYRIDIVESRKILHDFSSAAQSQVSFREGIRAEIDSWDVYLAVVLLAKSCAFMHFESHGELEVFVSHDPTQIACSEDVWNGLYLLLRDGGERICRRLREDCSKCLRKVGLKAINIGADPVMNCIAVGMTFAEARSVSFATHDELDALVSSIVAANLDNSSDHSP